MAASLLRRALLLLTRWFLLGLSVLMALLFALFFFGGFLLFRPGLEFLLVAIPVGMVLLYAVLSRWLAAPSREDLAADLPWVLWFWLGIPLVALVFAPWVGYTELNWSMPSSHAYAPNPLIHATLCLYLFVTALALATGRPTVPRVLLRLAVPWAVFLGALVLRFAFTPRPVFQG